MKIICISDTHEEHREIHDIIKNIEADVIIHAGDGANSKIPAINNNPLRDCLTWLDSFDHIKHKIYVPGNHDSALASGLIKKKDYPNINFLINEEIIIDGIKFYGSPITPTFGQWSYMCKRSKIDKYWKQIPNDTCILITHGPPHTILDCTIDFDKQIKMVGCKNLLNRVLEKQPLYHIFGHVHDENGIHNHGVRTIGNKCKTTFVNASLMNLKYQIVNKPIIIEI